MPFTYSNFTYDPSRQGFDSSAWRTAYGTPGVQAGNLVLQQAAAIHLGDCMRGDYIFSVNVPNSPAGGESRRWGLYSANKGAYAWFSIEGEQLLVGISDGTNSDSEAVTWDSDWSGSNTEFRLVWEAGQVHFYAGGTFQTTLSGDGVPRTPLAVYLSNANTDFMTVAYIEARGIQSFFMNIDHDDTVFAGGGAYAADSVSLAEDVTLFVQAGDVSVNDSLSLTESVSTEGPGSASVNDTVSIAEDVTVQGPGSASVNETASVAESVETSIDMFASVNDTASIAEDTTVQKVLNVSVNDSASIAEDTSSSFS